MLKFLKKPTTLFVGILVFTFLYRFLYFDYPLVNTETHRDYLIAKHILVYHDFPKAGPCCLFNGAYGPLRHPALYYYALAAILIIKQHFMFLTFVNFVLQLIPSIVIYFLTAYFFSRQTGLLAMLFFSFHQVTFKQALFVWQPHLIQPFIYGTFLTLFLFFRHRKLWWLITSILLLFVATTIHLSVLIIVPLWILVTVAILYVQKQPMKIYFPILFLFTFLSLILLALLFANASPLPLHLIHASAIDYGRSLLTNTSVYLSSVFGDSVAISKIGYVLLALSAYFLIRYFSSQYQDSKKRSIFFIIIIVGGFLASVSLFKARIWHFYLTPLFGITLVLFAYIITSSRKHADQALSVIWICLFLLQFLLYYPPDKLFMQNAADIDKAISAIAKHVTTLQIDKNYQKPNFFQIQVYSQGTENPTIADLAFLLPLEEKLKQQLIHVTDMGASFVRLNTARYQFVVCQSYGKLIHVQKECLQPFKKNFPTYVIKRQIYRSEPFTIFLASS